MKTFCLLFLLACFLSSAQQAAAPPPSLLSDSLNSELPRWLRFGGEFRSRVEGFTGGGGYKADTTDAYLLTRFRINMRIRPTPWLKFFVQGQDAHVFGKNQNPAVAPFQDAMDLRAAYVEFGDTEKKSIGLRAGRQELAFGEERLIGPSGWLNTPRHFDAVRLTLRRGRLRLDAFASSVVVVTDGQFNKRMDGNNLHGLYGGIENAIPKSTIEPYLLWRVAPRLRTEFGAAGNLDFKTTGARWVGKLPADFDYGVEVAGEKGSLGADDIGAWGGHWQIGRNFPKMRWKTRIYGEYNYASGDKDPRDGKRGTFDMIYPTAHDRWGLADQVGWRNIHNVRAAAEVRVHPKWLVKSSYHSYWLASARDGLYAANGMQVARVADGSAGRRVGQEADFQTVWTAAPTVQVVMGYAHLFPGQFLEKATPGKAYQYPFAQVTYTF